MSEEISYQCYICPICNDDHSEGNKDRCIENLSADLKRYKNAKVDELELRVLQLKYALNYCATELIKAQGKDDLPSFVRRFLK